MNYAMIKSLDSADGEGFRVALYVSGCLFKCQDCHNQELWDYNYGEKFTNDTLNYIYELLKYNHICGFSILGGEPLDPKNREEVCNIIRKIREMCDNDPLTKNRTIWLWTGYLYEHIIEYNIIPRDVLEKIDVIVDGLFDVSQRDVSLQFRGSRNQRIISVKRSLEINKPVCWNDGKLVVG